MLRIADVLRLRLPQVLSICNHMLDEVVGEDRAPRDFRAKFPDDVLQENLAGQLWFGAEVSSVSPARRGRHHGNGDNGRWREDGGVRGGVGRRAGGYRASRSKCAVLCILFARNMYDVSMSSCPSEREQR